MGEVRMRRFNYRIFIAVVVLIVFIIPLPRMVNAQNTVAEVGVFENFQVSPGATIQVPVSIRGVEELYGVDLILEFNPGILQIQDADPLTDGIQAGLGDFLDPGLLLYNTADNQAGTLRFTMSQYNPSEAKSGSGILLVITFEGVTPGESPLEITSVSLATRDGDEIASSPVSANLVVIQDAPTQAATYQILQQPTGLIVLNTFTPVPTNTPVPPATPEPTQIVSLQEEEIPEVSAETAEESSLGGEEGSPFLVRYWWLLLILLLVVIIIGVFGYKKISRDTKGS